MDLARSYEKRLLKFRAWLFDQPTLSLTEMMLARKTQRDQILSLEKDRMAELRDFYDLTDEEILATQTTEHKEKLHELFADVGTDRKLLDGYRGAKLFKTVRMMTAYTRFPSALHLLKYFNSLYSPAERSRINLLDYGCGVADYGLAFAVFGYNVTLCDIAGGNLDFSRWRFEVRNLPCRVIAVTDDNVYPDPGKQDIIIAGEVFEHLREPVQVLKNMHGALPTGGYLWYSGYPDHPRDVGYEHLAEAAEQREEAKAFVQRNFRSATRIKIPGMLYRKP